MHVPTQSSSVTHLALILDEGGAQGLSDGIVRMSIGLVTTKKFARLNLRALVHIARYQDRGEKHPL